MDEWPPPYVYIGKRPTSWMRLRFDEGVPPPHVHGCPECYEHVPCGMDCTLEPDLEHQDGTLSGSYFVCASCAPQVVERERVQVEEERHRMAMAQQVFIDLGA